MTAVAEPTPLRILVADPIAAGGVERLRNAGSVDVRTGMSPDELRDCVADYDALVVRSETQVTAAILDAGRRLRVVGRAGVGVDNIDIDAATHRGVLVLNAPTGNTIAAAEHALAMMLACARNVTRADSSLRAGKWERSTFTGVELRGKTLGLLGLGKIGFEVARMASQGLQMRVLANDLLVTPERAEQAGAELCAVDRLLAEADVLSVHVPMTAQTRGCIGAAELRRMKPGSRLINVARGGIIDERALADAVNSGHIAGAAVDVFTTEPLPGDNPLRDAPNIILTPHLGASTREAQVNVAYDVADQIVDYLDGGTPRYSVNAPIVRPEDLAALRPYLELAKTMGSLAIQLVGGELRQITCHYTGELADRDSAILTAETLRGIFAHFTDTRINPINARTAARERGVQVEERRSSRPMDYTNSMTVEVAGARHVSVTGTHFEGSPRITRIDDFRVDLQPSGIYLVITHADRPGVIAGLSSVLTKHDVNIAGIQLGRDRPRGRAVMFMQIDDPVSSGQIDEIRHAAQLDTIQLVRL